ncbi:hypothetical protein BJ322DRAFT_1214923 [Thelephora terrestris]|uniref:DUF6532 domain-containing protein n=1 Tax=Thelephora terrestris TaxID=56493 RepID=A0A9P6H382_9AGAM|nr:hypothetical protein BJ322DRAFT_1214923 [Thelephora terrestris]
MVQPNAPSEHVPPPPDGFLEYLALLSRNGSLPIPHSSPQTPIAATPPTPARSFNRPGRGTGGALTEKLKVSQQITAPASKRKSPVDPDIEAQLSLTPETAGGSNANQAKRQKTSASKVTGQRKKLAPAKGSKKSAALADPKPIPSPISTPAPPAPVRPVSRPAKLTRKVQSPERADTLPVSIGASAATNVCTAINVSTATDVSTTTDISAADVHDDEIYDSGEDPDSDVEVLAVATNSEVSTLAQGQTPTFTGPAIGLLQTYLNQYQLHGPPISAVQVLAPQPQPKNFKPSKGIKGYPDEWRKILIASKDVVRASILLKHPFPGPHLARITVNECFHEVFTTARNDGVIPEPGFSWSEHMLTILLTEVSTSRSELKKLAKLLVASDPELFPISEDQEGILTRSVPEIRRIASRLERRARFGIALPPHNPNHVRTSVVSRLTDSVYLNEPPTADGDLLAHPILEKLCKSFYKEDKWQRSLLYDANSDSEWLSSVTVTMVAFAATAYRNALEEWQTGNFVRKPFEGEKFSKCYTEIQDYVFDCLDDGPQGERVASHFNSWASGSAFVHSLVDDDSADN